MHGPAWLALLRRIPPEFHDSLVLFTTTGVEIIVQSLLRAERDFLVVRARMSGSTDPNRYLFVPFDQINYVGFTRKMTEPEMQAMLGKPGIGGGAPAAQSAPGPADAEEEDTGGFIPQRSMEPPAVAAAAETPAPGAPSPDGKGPPKAAHPSKSVLLARLRARLAGADPGKPADA